MCSENWVEEVTQQTQPPCPPSRGRCYGISAEYQRLCKCLGSKEVAWSTTGGVEAVAVYSHCCFECIATVSAIFDTSLISSVLVFRMDGILLGDTLCLSTALPLSLWIKYSFISKIF